jgi:hypothetical protein
MRRCSPTTKQSTLENLSAFMVLKNISQNPEQSYKIDSPKKISRDFHGLSGFHNL